MGAADIVPGISGGTIAFIMGFYNKLLESIKTFNMTTLKLLLKGEFKLFLNSTAWKFLLTLGAGISFSFITLAGFFHYVLEHETYRIYLYSIFLGLILASFVFCIKQVEKWKFIHISGFVFGAIFAYIFTGPYFISETENPYAIKYTLNDSQVALTNYNENEHLITDLSKDVLTAMVAKEVIQPDTEIFDNKGNALGVAEKFTKQQSSMGRVDVWLAFCGALAICALLLPGISGSYLLTLLGVYPLVIGSLADLVDSIKSFAFDVDAFYVLLSLAIGIFVGFLVFSRLVSWLLKSYPNFTIAVLSGCMIGALRTVWPFWTYTYSLNPLKLHKGPQLLLAEPYFPSIDSLLFYYGAFFVFFGFSLVFFVEFAAKTKSEPFAKPSLD